eukprot:gb/GECG01006782.1/.p1 GENE.gb/GECG01006782.1/~~gb/GECG01006782.1/.p1  ORF type:complete len:709 (+),score=48.80 gb/GECG01006782.1/:1-2127(+)
MDTPQAQTLRQRRQHSSSFRKTRGTEDTSVRSSHTPVSSANGGVDPQRAAQYKAHASTTWELDRWSLVLAVIIVLQIIGSPFTKVEESFHMQATHDILYHQTDLASYDHNDFPGPVPRSFVGPLIMAGASSMLASILTWRMLPKLLVHYVVRLCIGFIGWAAIARFRDAIHWRFGYSTSKYFAIIIATVPHVLFYISRPLGNNLALITTLFGLANWVENERTTVVYDDSGHPHDTNSKEDRCAYTIVWLTVAIVFFRCDVAVLLAPVCLVMLYKQQISLKTMVVVGAVTGIISIAISVAVDSLFWGKWVWPEGVVLFFNTVENKSSQWGTEPWHWYITSAIPRVLLTALLFFPVGLMWFRKGKMQWKLDSISTPFAVSAALFVGLYSILPHKELRFLFPSVPLFVLVCANGVAKFTMQTIPSYRIKANAQPTPAGRRRASSTDIAEDSSLKHEPKSGRKLRILCVTTLFLLNVGATVLFSVASSWNYPGGYALQQVHDIQDKSVLTLEQRRTNPKDRPDPALLNNSSVFPWPVPLPPSPVFHNPYDSDSPPRVHSVNMFQPVALGRMPWKVHISAEATMSGVTRFGERGWPWKYDKTEKIHPGNEFAGSSPYTYILAGDDKCQENAWTLVHVEKGYAGINVNAARMMVENSLRDIVHSLRGIVKSTPGTLSDRLENLAHSLYLGLYNIATLPRHMIRLEPKVYVCQKM